MLRDEQEKQKNEFVQNGACLGSVVKNKRKLEDCLKMDFFGKIAAELKDKKLFLFDMDGTIYEEERVFDGTRQLLQYIEEIGGHYVFITNNSSKSVVDYVEKMRRLNLRAEEENFFTSAQAAVLYLKQNYPGRKVYCQGTRSFFQELQSEGIDVTEDARNDIDVVLVGFDTELTSQKVRKTCQLLLTTQVVYLATNPDLRCPVSFGFIPDCGAICKMIECATNRKPLYIGKPERIMVDIVREKFGYKAEETVVVGDRLYTDIATGLNSGVTAVCVLTGEATAEEISRGEIKPDYTYQSVKELYKELVIA